ncbi:MAG TPA: hypothetical protein VFA26_10925 [Gemmataceae bacterium]|nr:hypothetical protein [Gemmataceae bacterium]
MTDYQIQPNTRRCAATGRELRPGEKFYSVLLDEGGKFVRHDYAGDAWHGPPPNAFSFWSGRVPAQEQKARLRIDDELLMDCFARLEGQPEADRVNFRYVVALLLMRRKRLKFEEARTEAGQEVLRLRCTRTGTQHDVINPGLDEEQMAAVQEEVFKVLGWE